MCEILVRVTDKVSPDPYKNVKLTKRGDVIVVQPDGWGWRPEELTNPDWRIVKLPNVTEAQAASFLAPEVDVDPQHPSRMLQRRAFKLDVDNAALPAAFAAYVADGTRAQPFLLSSFSSVQLNAFRVARPPVPDPNIL